MKKILYPHPVIAKEGWLFIGFSILLILLAIFLHSLILVIIFSILTAFIVQFFRDPPRGCIAESGDVVSPADGRIVEISECTDPYRQVPAKKISIFMNVFNVHSQRIPIDGEVIDITYTPGKFINASLNKSSEQNERNAIIIKSNQGQEITVVQVAGLIAKRILCYIYKKEQVKIGQRFGFIRFGSRVDLYLPLDTKILVTIGDKVYATHSILANCENL